MHREVDVERIRVRVSAVEPPDARALAHAIATGLAPTLCLGPGEAALERVVVSIDAAPDESVARLAERTVAQILARIGRATDLGVTR